VETKALGRTAVDDSKNGWSVVGLSLVLLPELGVETEMEIDDSTFVGQRSQG
jgi:hypothetical protein